MRRTLLLLAVFAPLAPALAGASSRASRTITAPDLTPGEIAVIEDARDDKLDRFDTVLAAIATSRAPSDVRERAQSRWHDFLQSITVEALARPPRERAEWLLRVLHEQVLTGGYSFFQNDVAVLLDDGTYNCVSSAVVYQAAAAALGLEVSGVLVPSHVYVRVRIDGTDYDIETTSARGFLLDRDDASYEKFLADMRLNMAKKYGRPAESEKFYRREIDAIDLIAMLYCNLGAKSVEDGQQAQAVAYFARAALLAKDDKYARDSRDILLGQMAEAHILKNELDDARRLFMYAIKDPGGDATIARHFRDNIGYCYALEAKQKSDKKDYEGALAAYASGTKWDDDPALPKNEAATYNQWGIQELEAKEYARAVSVFLRARNAFPQDPIFAQNLKAAYAGWIESRFAAKSYDESLSIAREFRTRMPGDDDAKNVFASAAARVAEARGDDGKWSDATALADEAVASGATIPGLKRSASAVWTNAGVAFVRAGDQAKAEAAWKRALEIDPASTAAKKNLDSIRR